MFVFPGFDDLCELKVDAIGALIVGPLHFEVNHCEVEQFCKKMYRVSFGFFNCLLMFYDTLLTSVVFPIKFAEFVAAKTLGQICLLIVRSACKHVEIVRNVRQDNSVSVHLRATTKRLLTEHGIT